MPTPIPTPVQETLDLLASELSEVRFPGLEPEVVKTAVDQTLEAAAAVAEAEEALERARAALTEAQEALLQKAHRAIAYARIYAEDDPALSARIDAIVLPKAPRRAQKPDKAEAVPEPSDSAKSEVRSPGRRGRPRKNQISEPTADACAAEDIPQPEQETVQ